MKKSTLQLYPKKLELCQSQSTVEKVKYVGLKKQITCQMKSSGPPSKCTILEFLCGFCNKRKI